jgi:hypothetical protein
LPQPQPFYLEEAHSCLPLFLPGHLARVACLPKINIQHDPFRPPSFLRTRTPSRVTTACSNSFSSSSCYLR